jgi:hypothetical protein
MRRYEMSVWPKHVGPLAQEVEGIVLLCNQRYIDIA